MIDQEEDGRRARPASAIGKQHRRIFLEAVATGCNVKAAARAIGKSTVGLYRLRQRDPAFAAEWAEALQTGYARLESELLARAMGNGDSEAPGQFDADLAMKLMTYHKAIERGGVRRGGAPLRVATLTELADALDKRFAALDRRRAE